MTVVVLAAGVGRRLQVSLPEQPKCLLDLGGQTIIERMVCQFVSRGLQDVVLVLGFQATRIQNFLLERFPHVRFEFCYNSSYESTNNAYSLLKVKDLIDGGFLLCDGDIVFDSRVLDLVLGAPYDNVLALRRTQHLGDEEMKLRLDPIHPERIMNVSKEIHPTHAAGESIGIARFSRQGAQHLFKQLEVNIVQHNKIHDFYERTFQDLIDLGVDLYSVDLGTLQCAEIDFIEDLEHVKQKIIPHIDSIC